MIKKMSLCHHFISQTTGNEHRGSPLTSFQLAVASALSSFNKKGADWLWILVQF